MGYNLSVLIPARNEYYLDIDLLHETVVNVLANTSKRTQVIAVLDGYTDSWPKQPLPVNDRLTVIHHRQSIGQRAATNEAARVATGEYLMKLDAHCALDERFDEKLLATFEPQWTVVPSQFNLLAFNWRCSACGNLHDQGPQPNRCEKCKGRRWQQQKLWIPRDGREGSNGTGGKRNSLTHSWRFDSQLNFAYWGAYTADERHAKKHGVPFRPETQQPIHDTMSLLGACWAIRRERYFELDICEEAYGSWGDQGTEISCKTHLSGGELKVNTTTWFAHFFRVGGLGFPYPDGGRKERAKARGKEVWLKNAWPLQVYPLSWLIEKFRPVPDWHVDGNAVLDAVQRAGDEFWRSRGNFSSTGSIAGKADGMLQEIAFGANLGHLVTPNADTSTLAPSVLGVVRLQNHVDRVAARLVITDKVIEDGNTTAQAARQWSNQPSIHKAMGQLDTSTVTNMSVSESIARPCPNPASGSLVDNNPKEDISQPLSTEVPNSEKPSLHGLIIPRNIKKGLLYYSCNSHDDTLEMAARNNLLRCKNGYELGAVTLKRTDFGDWSIVLDQPKGPLTMHQQILAGLERSTADYVFFCENDVLYHESHFEFVPPRDDVYYYNTNVWRVRYGDGFAIRTNDCKQLSGLCASRELLVRHYRTRVQRISGEGFSRRNGYEPGTRKVRHGGYDDIEAVSWSSPFPNLDIKSHGQNVTKGQWSPDDFRNKKYTEGWQESTRRIEPWPLFYGRLQEWLKGLADGL